MKIVIIGEPRGKQRPRFNMRTGTTYTPSETVAYEKAVHAAYYEAGGNEETKCHGAVELLIKAYYGIPKTAPKSAKDMMLQGLRKPNRKPDIDNVIKIVMDGLTGAAYDDDKQVVSVSAMKIYGGEPRVEVWIEEVDG